MPTQAAESGRLLVVSPVYNEAAHLETTARALAAQTRIPDRWIVVDDGSTDATLAIARRLERELGFLTVIEAGGAPAGADNLALAREAHAFNVGLRFAEWEGYEYVGKLDGDVELPPEWFATLTARLAADPALGLVGGRLQERTPRGWRVLGIPDYHVHGAVKLFRRGCLEAIGGVAEQLAWDTIDETYARMHGFATRSYPDLLARHHRAWGSADGRLRGCARHGECAWILHYSLPWVSLRSLKVAGSRPWGVSGAAFLYGYLRAAARGVPRVPDPRFRRFVRRELRGRMRAPRRPGRASTQPAG